MTILVIFTFLTGSRVSKVIWIYLSLFGSAGSIWMRFSGECHDTSSRKHKIVLLFTTLPLFINMALAKLTAFYLGTMFYSLSQPRPSDKKVYIKQ